MMDNNTAIAYINNMGGIRSDSCDHIAFDIWKWVAEQQIWISAAHIRGFENVIVDKISRMFQRSSEWKLTEKVFKQIATKSGKPDIHLLASRINHQLPNYISWRHGQAVDVFSINRSKTYNYCFPPFSIILKVLKKIQDKAQDILVVLFWAAWNWSSVFLGMLVDHPLITTALLKKLHTHPIVPHPLHHKLRLPLAHIYEEVLICKMFQHRHNMFSCPFGENQPEEDIP